MIDQTALIDPAAERAVLAEGLRAHDRYVGRGLSAEDYGDPAHRLVAEALAAVFEAGSTPDLDTVGLYLQRAGKLEHVGGQRGLAELAASVGEFPDHERVRELRKLRDLSRAALQIHGACARGDLHGAMGLVADLQADALAKTQGRTKTASDLAEVALQGIVDDARNGRRVYPGIDGIRRCVGSYQRGAMYIIGASSNVGKTSLAIASMMGMAYAVDDYGAPCPVQSGYSSMEDPDDLLGARLLAHVSGVSSRRFTGALGQLTPEDMSALGVGADKLRRLRDALLFDDCMGGNELDVCAAMTRQAQRGAKVCFVDYIQEVEPSKKQDDRRQAIRWVAGRLKSHAKRLNVALVLLSQITDVVDGKRRPTFRDLRDCKDLGMKAENVLMAWRKQDADDAPIQVYLSKGKSGGLGTEFYMRRNAGGRLEEIDDSEAPEYRREDP